jgi:hypothetical protein
MKKLIPLFPILISIILLFSMGCSPVDNDLITFANNFCDNLNQEVDACKKLISEYNNSDSGYISTQFYNDLNISLSYYNSINLEEKPEDLRYAVTLARDGTEKIISGVHTINDSADHTTGRGLVNEGIALLNKASSTYNNFKDAYNRPNGNGAIVGSAVFILLAILWLIGILFIKWYKRHLNWAYMISWGIMILFGFISGIAFALVDPFGDISPVIAVVELVNIVIILIISGWVIHQKGRSLGWIFLAGIFSPVWLSNHKEGFVDFYPVV